ncbi:MAG: ABC transporter permease [Treponema sp.]|jgi:spermidine/putrescine transport system permease protein|nr:ABC transporter permease [Treponema sp.]
MKRKRGIPSKAYLAAVLLIMYIPIALVIVYSFNRNRISSMWSGFSWRWYAELFRDRAMWSSLWNSVFLGVTASVGAAVIGSLAATGLSRAKLPGAAVMSYIGILPIMIPEIVLGMVSLAFFALLALPFGMLTLVIAHTAMCIPYSFIMVKARLEGIDKGYVEAAKDLGAGEWRAFYDITLPLIMPAVVSSMLISFAMSFDDVIISVFVTGVNTNTLPIRIYTQMKVGVTPKTNAMCTLLFAATVVLVLLSAAVSRPRKFRAKSKARP